MSEDSGQLTADSRQLIEPIVVVTGFGRCGTSMVMKMLHAGGVEPYAEPGNIGSSYETEDLYRLPEDHGWLAGCRGKAVKVLEPHRCRPPRKIHPYRFVLILRNPLQQAKSQAKLLRTLCSLAVDRRDVAALACGIRRDEKVVKAMLAQYPDSQTLVLDFEFILDWPHQAAQRLEEFLGRPLDCAAMAAIVRPRAAECAPDMAFELSLAEEAIR